MITKSLGTDNAMNIVKAAAEGLKNMESPVQVAERRGISVAEMFGGKENYWLRRTRRCASPR